MSSGSNLMNDDQDSSASSSRAISGQSPNRGEDDEIIHFLDGDDTEILRDDPLGDGPSEPISFKRKQKQSVLSQPSGFLSTLTGNRFGGSQSPHSGTPLHALDTGVGGNRPFSPAGPKEGEPLDWYVEGPGRRVGYEDLTAIDWIFEYTKERQRLRALYSSASGILGYIRLLLDSSQIWVILVLTGIAVGTLAAGIDVASNWLGDIKIGFCSREDGGAFYLNRDFCCLGYDQGDKCLGWKPWATALGITSVGGKWFIEYFFFLLLSRYTRVKDGLGGLHNSAVSKRLDLGYEIPGPARKREVLSAAAASGISVAFGSPIGGVLFSLEQLSYYFPDKTMWQSFVCAMTAAVVLQAFDPFRLGKLVLYQVKFKNSWHGFEIIPFALLGILGGIYGGLFIKANMRVAQWRKSKPWLPGPVTQVFIVALLTALINYPNFYMRAQSSELVSSLFTDCALVLDDQFGLCKTGAATAGTIVLLIFGAILGFFLASITFGLHIPAGIILPSMAIGALTGRAVGLVMEIWQRNNPGFLLFSKCEPDVPCVTPGVYAIIGAAAALGGVTRMTVSIVVIMFELTGALTYVLPIMVAVMISKWVGDAFSRRGIYESWIHLNGYPFLDSGEDGGAAHVLPDAPASQIMTRIEDLVVLTATGHTIASLRSVLDSCPYRGFPVVSDARDAVLLGYISRADLAYNLDAAAARNRERGGPPPEETEAFFARPRPTPLPLGGGPLHAASSSEPGAVLDLRPWMDQTPLTLPSRASLHLAVSYFQKLGVRYVLFTDRGVLQGLLTKKDCWYVLNGAEETRRTAAELGIGDAEEDIDGSGENRGLLGGDGGGGGHGGDRPRDSADTDAVDGPLVERGGIL
ncbi:hypothetical protein DL766_000264 [Monosporascus sp. MC13-8B]|nr:hypothetical protein DL763_008625 [Monosporascus cannonballus]RYP39822.1 hypothetical protein DL766_000264 [Monosporascus sp. MC13-8B]